jgi:hypothetical protein
LSQKRSLFKSLAVAITIAASTIACGDRGFEPSHPGNGRLEPAAEEKSEPDSAKVWLRAQTRQEKSGPAIRVSWNASAQPVRRSSYGILYIYDGGVPNQLVLQRRALDFGSTDYAPRSDEVTFHLILERGRSEGDYLLVLLGAPAGSENEMGSTAATVGFEPVKH